MLKIQPKKLLASLLTAALAISMFPMAAFENNVSAASNAVVTNYLKDTDIITISPAENRNDSNTGTKRLADSDGWSLTVQNNNCNNGDDLQMWQYGVSDKLRVWHYNKNSSASGAFWLCAVNWRETPSPRFVDVEGRKNKNGANIHVWSQSNPDNKDWNGSTKWLQLVDDGDSDPETFYIKNVKTGKFLAPENYFKSNKDYKGRQCLAKGKNTVLSDQEFSWRVEVINRTPESVKGQREWMKKINGSTPLSAINIPGTHDACTANVEGSWNESSNFIACQKYFIPEQLEVGVRSLDLRMKYKKNDGLVMIHGSSIYVCHTEDTSNSARNMTFDDVMGYMKNYLAAHPSETIIATFKNDDGQDSKTLEEFKKVISKYSDIMYNWDNLGESESPTLDQVRGKIVGFSRFSGCSGGVYGPDLSEWDNRYSPGKSHYAQLISNEDAKPAVYTQDNYSTSASPKMEYVYDTIADANNQLSKVYSNKVFLFNYTSAITVTPLTVAQMVNQYIRTDDGNKNFYNYIRNKKRLGIMTMDFIDAQIAKMIYQSNGTYGGNSSEYMNLNKIGTYNSVYSTKALDDNTSVYDGEDYRLTVTWPTPDRLMYGYSLGDAGFNGGSATVTLSDGSEYVADGKFVFKDSELYPSVGDSDSTLYTLTFVPIDSAYPVLEKQTTITVVQRPLDVYIGDYKQQYGDTAESWRDVVSVVGRVAEKDWDQLSKINMSIEKDGIENKLNFSGNTRIADILTADLPVGTNGAVSVSYEGKTVTDFSNYDIDVQASGTWEIVPRQLTINWSGQSHYLSGDKIDVTAEIGNIYNNEDVSVKIRTVQGKTNNGVTEFTAKASLVGNDAANYELPEDLSTFTYTLSAASKVLTEPDVRLSETTYMYDGTEKVPAVSVYDNGMLVPSDEYTVEYSNNVRSGLASVVITDKSGGHYDFVFYDNNGEETNSMTVNYIIEGDGSAEYINGDISGNGQIDLYDAVIISKYLLGMVELSEEEIQIADYNGDGSVDLYDAIGIAEYLLENLQK